MKIAFIGYQVQEKYNSGTAYDEDAELLGFLREKGLDIVMEIWNDPAVNWALYDVAIIKSPWDYHDHIQDFYQWLEWIRSAGVKLLNPVETVKWNSDKHYLQEIADAGLPVIPTVFLEKGERPELSELFKKLKTEKLIIKPCVSAGAKNTVSLTMDSLKMQEEQVYQLLMEESLMAQPFMKEIYEGEWSYLFFNGKFSHSLLKVPKSGDFRVQHYHGGTVVTAEATAVQVAAAEAYVKQFAAGTLYARVDGVNKDGELLLMELELIEPYLFLNTAPSSFEWYYTALQELASENS